MPTIWFQREEDPSKIWAMWKVQGDTAPLDFVLGPWVWGKLLVWADSGFPNLHFRWAQTLERR